MHIDEVADPIDRCVYPRPFPAEFSACRSYQPVTFLAADSRNKPLGSWLTCRHLAVGKHGGLAAGFYPRCGLGAGGDRLRWLTLVGPAWVDVVRALQEEFDEFIAPYRDSLFGLKAQLLEARDATAGERRRELQARLGEFLQATRGFLDERGERFSEVGMPVGPLMELVEEWASAWVRSPSLGSPEVSAAQLGVFAPPVQAMLGAPRITPWRAGEGPLEAPAQAPKRLHADDRLKIFETFDPPGLSFFGEIDAGNRRALLNSLELLKASPAEVVIDLSGLLFCDLGGMRAFVAAASTLTEGGRLVLKGVPAELERAMSIVGWADLPTVKLTSRELIEA